MFWTHLKQLHVHGSSARNTANDISPEEINQHFLNNQKPNNFDSKLVTDQTAHFLNVQCATSFGLETTTEAEVLDIIQSISSQAVGSDDINLKAIRHLLPFIIHIITHIINYSITSGSYPNLWKLAIITPISKNSRAKGVMNLRPISILPCLSKILERVVANQFKAYLEEGKILNSAQSGFRSKHSTTTALIKISNDILTGIDESKFTSLVLLDFAKAFDTVNHELLLAKLHAIGVDRLSMKWFECYLTGRKQCVRVGNNTSSYLDVISGVPQGSILGPLLFSIFINDLPKCVKHSADYLFADDVQVANTFSVNNSFVALSNLNEDLHSIYNWTCNNGLSLNTAKCQHIIIGSPQLFQRHPLNEISHFNSVSINNTKLSTCLHVKNLGLLFDKHLSWNVHITTQCRTALQRIRYLSKFKNFLSIKTKRTLASALVIPLLDYCDTVYLNASKGLLKKVQKVQNACVRFILNIKKYEHVSVNFKKLKWVNMEKRRSLHSLLYIYKTLKYKEPSYLFNLVNAALTKHNYPTRFSKNQSFTPPRCRTANCSLLFWSMPLTCGTNSPLSTKMRPLPNLLKVEFFANSWSFSSRGHPLPIPPPHSLFLYYSFRLASDLLGPVYTRFKRA